MAAFAKVVVCSGHVIDRPERATPRFPASKEDVVRQAIGAQLDAWGVGRSDLTVCGGACGADILCAEECQRRGATVWLRLALPHEQLVKESAAFVDQRWVERLEQLEQTCEFSEQEIRPGLPSEGMDAFSRCNVWILDSARAELRPNSRLYALLVWDEKPAGDGPGGTFDFAMRVQQCGGEIAVINPLKID